MPNSMTQADARSAGNRQASTATRLRLHQIRGGVPYSHETVGVGGDIEPVWNPPAISRNLVGGASDPSGPLYLDFGNAGGCPPQPGSSACYNNWTPDDLCAVSWGGSAFPLPEIYHSYDADQWVRVQSHCAGGYFFFGVTGTAQGGGVELSPTEGWKKLSARTNGNIDRELVKIRDN